MNSDNNFEFISSIEDIIKDAKSGKMFILVDDPDRENEGDLIIPAQMINPESINFMAKYGRGLICLALTKKRIDELQLPLMNPSNQKNDLTAFTVSIEAKKGITTGISAADRAHTISVAIDKSKIKDDIVSPGHIFPVMAWAGGVLERAGHTEAAVDISRIAGLNPSAVICEIMNEDGTMARLKDLIPFCRKHNLKIGSIADLIRYRVNNDPIIKRKKNKILTTKLYGVWKIFSYEDTVNNKSKEHLALVKGELNNNKPVLVRVHVSNFISDSFNAYLEKSNRKNYLSLDDSMTAIEKNGSGLIVIINNNENMSNLLEDKNIWETEDKIREHGIGAQIIRDHGVKEMILLSKSKREVIGLEGFDIKVLDQRDVMEN